MSKFDMEQVNELAIHTPTLLHILKAVTDNKAERRNRDATIALCASVLLKYQYQNMSICSQNSLPYSLCVTLFKAGL